MEKKQIFKLISLAGLALGGIGTLLSGWADDQEQDAIIEEKSMKRLPIAASKKRKSPNKGSSLFGGALNERCSGTNHY